MPFQARFSVVLSNEMLFSISDAAPPDSRLRNILPDAVAHLPGRRTVGLGPIVIPNAPHSISAPMVVGVKPRKPDGGVIRSLQKED